MSSVHHWSPLIIKTVEKEEKRETEAERLYFSYKVLLLQKCAMPTTFDYPEKSPELVLSTNSVVNVFVLQSFDKTITDSEKSKKVYPALI